VEMSDAAHDISEDVPHACVAATFFAFLSTCLPIVCIMFHCLKTRRDKKVDGNGVPVEGTCIGKRKDDYFVDYFVTVAFPIDDSGSRSCVKEIAVNGKFWSTCQEHSTKLQLVYLPDSPHESAMLVSKSDRVGDSACTVGFCGGILVLLVVWFNFRVALPTICTSTYIGYALGAMLACALMTCHTCETHEAILEEGIRDTADVLKDLEAADQLKAVHHQTLSQQLHDLASLHSRGLLSVSEFNAAKARLLGPCPQGI